MRTERHQRDLFESDRPLPKIAPDLRAKIAALVQALPASRPPRLRAWSAGRCVMTKITAEHLARGAFVYVRQSTADQVHNNHESRRRQYGLADRAHRVGVRCAAARPCLPVFFAAATTVASFTSPTAARMAARGVITAAAGQINHGGDRCISFGGMRVDRAVGAEVIERLQPLGIEAALAAAETPNISRTRRSDAKSNLPWSGRALRADSSTPAI